MCALHPFQEEMECIDNPGSVPATLPQWGALPSCLEAGRLERRGLGPWWCWGSSESQQPWSLLYLRTFWFCVSRNLLLSFGLGFLRSYPRARIQGKWLIWKVIPGNTSRRVRKWHRGGKYCFVFKIAFHLFIGHSSEALRILIPWPGIKPTLLSAIEAWSLNPWTTREVPGKCVLRSHFREAHRVNRLTCNCD